MPLWAQYPTGDVGRANVNQQDSTDPHDGVALVKPSSSILVVRLERAGKASLVISSITTEPLVLMCNWMPTVMVSSIEAKAGFI